MTQIETEQALDTITLDTWTTLNPEHFTKVQNRLSGRMAELAMMQVDPEVDQAFEELNAA